MVRVEECLSELSTLGKLEFNVRIDNNTTRTALVYFRCPLGLHLRQTATQNLQHSEQHLHYSDIAANNRRAVDMAYTDDAVKAKLSALNETQESIVTVAQWVMFHRYGWTVDVQYCHSLTPIYQEACRSHRHTLAPST